MNSSSTSFKDYVLWYLLGNGTVLALLILIFLVESRRYFRQVFAIFKTARQPEPGPATP